MPQMTGMECARALRELQEQGELNANCKIVLISGDDFNRRQSHELQYLFDETMSKPIQKNDFH